MILFGFITAFAFWILILKLPTVVRHRLLAFDIVLDIAITIAMMLAFAGTFSGMGAAMVGGLIFSALLAVTKWGWGYEAFMTFKYEGKWRARWVPVPGKLTKTRSTTCSLSS